MRGEEAVSRLLEWGLVDRRAIVEGDLELSSVARRNRNWKVESHRGGSYLVKQPEPGTTAVRTLETEARFYAFCDRESAAAGATRFMVRHRPVASESPVLVVELVENGRSLWRELRARPAEDLPLAVFTLLGQALATIHQTFRSLNLSGEPTLAELDGAPPWPFRLNRPRPPQLRRLSPARRLILKIVQSEAGIYAALDRVVERWRTETLIHGDIRSGNVLVVAGDDGRPSDLRLIDWELVQRGDSAWDLAGAFQDLILFWLLSMPRSADLDSRARVAEAEYPLAMIQSAMRALWGGYAERRALAGDSAEAFLRRAVPYAGVRMIQTAWEYGRERERLPSVAVLLMQVVQHVLENPTAARIELFGLAEP